MVNYTLHQYFVQIEYLKVVTSRLCGINRDGTLLTEQSGLELGKVTTRHCSCHIGDMDNEKENYQVIRSIK